MKTLTHLCLLGALLFLQPQAYAQLISITGTVKNEFSGEAIRQLSIVDKQSGIGTISSEDGSFFLTLKKGNVRLVFSDKYYETKSVEFKVQNDTTLHVAVKHINRLYGKKAGSFPERGKLVALKENDEQY